MRYAKTLIAFRPWQIAGAANADAAATARSNSEIPMNYADSASKKSPSESPEYILMRWCARQRRISPLHLVANGPTPPPPPPLHDSITPLKCKLAHIELPFVVAITRVFREPFGAWERLAHSLMAV